MPLSGEAVRNFFDETDRYLKRRFDIRIRTQIVREMVGELRDGSVIDLGCGDGSISRQFCLPGNHVTMVDVSARMLEAARRAIPESCRARVAFSNADFTVHRFDREYDLVLCIGVLAHVESPEQAVRKAARLCRPGGRCIIQLTDADRIISRILRAYAALRFRVRGGYLTNRTTESEVLAMGMRYGLKPVESRRYSLLLPGIRRLPDEWVFRYQMLGLNNSFLSRMGTDVIVHFRKEGSEEISSERDARSVA